VDRWRKRTLAAVLAIAVAASAQAPTWAAELPANIELTLVLSAGAGDDSLLAAVREAVAARPELVLEIVEAAILLQPDLAVEIRLAAAATGEITVAPAVGPLGFALAPILGGAGAAGAVAAAAAGGAGGSSTDDAGDPAPLQSIPPQPPQPQGNFEANEYLVSNGLAPINASAAYSRGLTGAGVIVAVFDTGLDAAHPELLGRVVPGGFNFVENNADIGDPQGHGTHVAGIIAANKDDAGMQGVAYGASILPIRIADANGRIALSSATLAAAVDYAVASGAFVLNNSWGALDEFVTGLTTVQVNTRYAPEIAAYQRAAAAGRVVVFAAQNAGNPNPSPRAGLPYYVPDLQPNWLAVVAIDQSGAIASYSNRCGVAAAWCVAAPGSGIVSARTGGGYRALSGTSMAAPHVSAALAILRQLFPELSADVIVQRLLTTANGSGIYANQSVYGWGLLDLAAATRPVGATSVLTGATIADASFRLSDTNLRLGAAFGDGLKNAVSGMQLAVFDSQRATFFVDLEPFVQLADVSTDLPGMLDRFGNVDKQTFSFGSGTLAMALTAEPVGIGKDSQRTIEAISFVSQIDGGNALSLSFNEDPALAFGLHGNGSVDSAAMIAQDAFASPFLSLTDDTLAFATSSKIAGLGDLRITSFTGSVEEGGEGDAFGTAMEIAMQPHEAAKVAMQFGIVAEESTFLGTRSQGAFGFANNTPTLFSGLSANIALNGKLSLVGSIYTGISTPSPSSQSLFADISPIQSQSFSLGLVGRDLLRRGDGFGVILNQPLRVSSGSADIALTNGRDAAGNLSVTNFTADLTPSGRELDFEVFYNMALGAQTSLAASALLRHEPGHIADADNEGILALRLRRRF